MTRRSRVRYPVGAPARLAQLVERTAFNRMVVGSSPTVGTFFWYGLMVRHPAFYGVNEVRFLVLDFFSQKFIKQYNQII